MKLLIQLVIATVFINLFFLDFKVYSQENSTSLQASPAIVESVAKPGSEFDIEIRINNPTNIALPVSVTPSSISLEDELITDSESERFDIEQWISTEEEIVIVGSEESEIVTINFSIPSNALPGGHYGAINFQGLSLGESRYTDIGNVIPEISVPILLNVPGEIDETVVINTEDVFNSLYFSNSISADFSVENRGSVHNIIVPTLILNKGDSEVFRESFDARVLLPGTKRNYKEAININSPGVYTAKIEIGVGTPVQIISSGEERITVFPQIWQIIIVGFSSYGIAYIFQHRRNIKKTVIVLIKS